MLEETKLVEIRLEETKLEVTKLVEIKLEASKLEETKLVRPPQLLSYATPIVTSAITSPEPSSPGHRDEVKLAHHHHLCTKVSTWC